MNNDFFNQHVQIMGIGFGSPKKDKDVSKKMKKHLKDGFNK